MEYGTEYGTEYKMTNLVIKRKLHADGALYFFLV